MPISTDTVDILLRRQAQADLNDKLDVVFAALGAMMPNLQSENPDLMAALDGVRSQVFDYLVPTFELAAIEAFLGNDAVKRFVEAS